jgi:hypothetical protein
MASPYTLTHLDRQIALLALRRFIDQMREKEAAGWRFVPYWAAHAERLRKLIQEADAIEVWPK